MTKVYALIGVLVLSSLAWGQYRSWSLFDDVSMSQPVRSSGGGSRFYHK